MTLPPGTRLGPYAIVGWIGAGGMGEVYRAHDTRLGRDVAIKVIPAELARDPERIKRFEQEARAAGALNHPNVCTILDIGTHEGAPFVVMELLEGESLRARFAAGPILVRKAVDWAAQAAHGLAAAHEKGIVHRDLKPENLFITKDGRVKVLDFGLAKLTRPEVLAPAGEKPISIAATETGAILGTVGYMAPEQVRGQGADARSDLFALGAILYESLTGRRAFHGASYVETLHAILNEEPSPLSASGREIPPGLDPLVRRCLEKEAAERFQSASDLAFALEAVSRATEGTPGAMHTATPSRRPTSRLATIVAAAAVLAALAFFAGRGSWRTAASAAPSYQRLTFRRGTIGRARFAPDGQTVVYDARWDGRPSEIFSLRPGNPESRPFGIADARLLSISSSGELAVQLRPMLFNQFNKGTLARVPLGGGEPRAVRDDVYDADWTRDEDRLAVAPSDSDWFYVQMPLGTSIARPLYGALFLRVTPDGRGVAFWRPTATNAGGELAFAEPGKPERVLCSIDFICTGLAWNPRTREVWYSETDTTGSTSVCAVSPNGHRRQLLRLAGIAALQDVAANDRVLLSTESRRRVIEVLGPGQTEERDLSWLDNSSPWDLSPDGRMLVFGEEGVAGGRTAATYLRSTDGAPAVRLGEGTNGALSPDRNRVAVWVRGTPPKLRVLPVGAGEARDVAIGGLTPLSGQYWFPDGRRLLFWGQAANSPAQMFEVPVEGGKPRPVIPPAWGIWMGERPLSPDGRYLAASDYHGANRIFPVQGGPSRAVPGDAPGDVVLGWTGDSHGLYVFRRGEVPARIYHVDVATGQRRLWREVGPADRAGVALVYWAVIAGDDRSYAYTFDRVQDDLYLVTGLK